MLLPLMMNLGPMLGEIPSGIGNTSFLKKKVSYKKPPTFTEAYLASQSRIEEEATRLALESVPIEEADEDDLSDEVLMALTVRLLH